MTNNEINNANKYINMATEGAEMTKEEDENQATTQPEINLFDMVDKDATETMAIDEKAEDLYEEYIAEQYFGYAETGEELLSILDKGGKGFTYNKPYPHIETSKSAALQAIRSIMSS